MGSTLKVDNIVGTSGTSAPITLSGDTATLGTGTTLGSAVTFPTGHVIQTSTPTIFINEKKYEGKHKYENFRKEIKKLL